MTEIEKNEGHNLVVITGADDESNTLFYWIPAVPVVPDFVVDNWDGENDG